MDEISQKALRSLAGARQETGTHFALQQLRRLQWRSLKGAEMKIYLLILLIGALLTTIHFTQVPEKGPKSVTQ
ncbi:MAG: hypothetical protein ACRCV5_09465 [Afipia sp.]